MRRGTQDVCTYTDDDGNFVGICCGWDYTAEHEWGIKGIQRQLGIRWEEEGLFGLDRRKINNPPPNLSLTKVGDTTYLVCHSDNWDGSLCSHDKEELKIYDFEGAKPNAGAWDADAWGFATTVPEVAEQLKELAEALQQGDGAVYLGGMSDNPFARNGLCIVIASRLPQDVIECMSKVDETQYKLEEAVKKTGIEDQLKEAGLRYYALKPAWKTELKRTSLEDTEHPVVFFLNPHEQKQYAAGWFTVEQLQEWIRGEGPVIKSE